METESGAKIAIRGKGSVKEGKGRSDAAHASNQEEDLHCLIMADTEDKVNKAKKLIHNVIETVSISLPSPSPCFLVCPDPNCRRLLQFPKGRTSSSVTNFASLLLSTEPFVTMRTKHARTVARSVTANTTVPRSRTLLLASSVVCVAMQATWVAIVLIGREARVGVTTLLAVAHRLALVEKPMLTMRYVSPSTFVIMRDIRLQTPPAIHGRDWRWCRACTHRGWAWSL